MDGICPLLPFLYGLTEFHEIFEIIEYKAHQGQNDRGLGELKPPVSFDALGTILAAPWVLC